MPLCMPKVQPIKFYAVVNHSSPHNHFLGFIMDDGHTVEVKGEPMPNSPHITRYLIEAPEGGTIGPRRDFTPRHAQKTLDNSTADQAKDQVKDLKVWGDGDAWKLICKASSKRENWMKSTKAMQVPGGCLVQVTTQQGSHVAEAVTFVPGVMIMESHGVGTDEVVERSLVRDAAAEVELARLLSSGPVSVSSRVRDTTAADEHGD